MKNILLVCLLACTSLCKAQLNADFTWCPEPDPTGTLCCYQFINLSTDSGGVIVSYMWDFGDGSTGTTIDPLHCYFSIGTYIITLIVADNNGNSDTAWHPLTITHLDTAGCNCDSLNGVFDLPVAWLKVRISPNPFHTSATISITSQTGMHDIQLRIYNTLGDLVRELTIFNPDTYRDQSIIFNRENLSDGLYFYELRTPDSELLPHGKILIN